MHIQENIHTAEVTLHELNVLHDGIDLTGPLRLQLSAVPRFITRYHALREQVAQLTLAAGLGDELHPHEAIGSESFPSEAGTTHPTWLNDFVSLTCVSSSSISSTPST